MEVFNSEFKQAVLDKLNTLGNFDYKTRKQICSELGMKEDMEAAITLVMNDPEFSKFESVRSRGIRKKTT